MATAVVAGVKGHRVRIIRYLKWIYFSSSYVLLGVGHNRPSISFTIMSIKAALKRHPDSFPVCDVLVIRRPTVRPCLPMRFRWSLIRVVHSSLSFVFRISERFFCDDGTFTHRWSRTEWMGTEDCNSSVNQWFPQILSTRQMTDCGRMGDK